MTTLGVLHVHSGNLYGGVERIMVTLAKHPTAQLKHHFALCFRGLLSDELQRAGAKTEILGDVRMSRPWTVARARKALSRTIVRVRPDVVVYHSAWSLATLGRDARRRRLPIVFWVHGHHGNLHPLYRIVRPTRPDHAICNSRFTAQGLTRLFPEIPFSVLYAPVPPLQMHAGDREDVRTELGTPANTVVVVQVARLEPGKGHASLLGALAEMRVEQRWECWLVGGAQRRSELRYLDRLVRLAHDAGIGDRVRFLGQRPDVPRILAAADLFCHPNVAPEAFGIVFVEALYAGVPVVGTEMGGATEIVTDECGVLTPPGSLAALTGALERLISDPRLRERLGARGPDRARELCDPEPRLAELAAILNRVVEAA